jgi:hypothetical protein
MPPLPRRIQATFHPNIGRVSLDNLAYNQPVIPHLCFFRLDCQTKVGRLESCFVDFVSPSTLSFVLYRSLPSAPEEMENDISCSEPILNSPEAAAAMQVQQKYAEERNKRLRPDGVSQFIDLNTSDKFKRPQDDLGSISMLPKRRFLRSRKALVPNISYLALGLAAFFLLFV